MKIQAMLGILALTTLLYCSPFIVPVQAEQVSLGQIKSLLPNNADLQGFTHFQPLSSDPNRAANVEDSDFVDLNQDVTQWAPGRSATLNRTGTINRIGRRFLAENGLYEVNIEITLCSSPETANVEAANFRQGAQSIYTIKSRSDEQFVGDASWAAGATTLLFINGNMMVYISADRTPVANRQENIVPFPISALKAVACQILLRASQQPELTGISVQQAHMDVNSHALPKNALQVAGQTYVPVTEFAKAMGLTAQWNTKTGLLTLSGVGHETVALTAGSTAATVGGVKAAALTVPVLKQDGQPVMTLTDLLAVTGGHITGRTGNTVQVKG